MPPDRLLGCLSHINGAMQYLHDRQGEHLPAVKGDAAEEITSPIHCARTVLEEVRKRTNVGEPLMERGSVVFDGGVGLRGGACGALVGAIMPISVLMMMDPRDTSWLLAYQDMLFGLHTLRAGKFDRADDPYAVAGRIVTRFKNEVNSLDCSTITGKSFSDWGAFQTHMHASDGCSRLIEFCIEEGVSAIDRYQRAGQW